MKKTGPRFAADASHASTEHSMRLHCMQGCNVFDNTAISNCKAKGLGETQVPQASHHVRCPTSDVQCSRSWYHQLWIRLMMRQVIKSGGLRHDPGQHNTSMYQMAFTRFLGDAMKVKQPGCIQVAVLCHSFQAFESETKNYRSTVLVRIAPTQVYVADSAATDSCLEVSSVRLLGMLFQLYGFWVVEDRPNSRLTHGWQLVPACLCQTQTHEHMLQSSAFCLSRALSVACVLLRWMISEDLP